MDEPSADEEAGGGNGPNGGLRDFSYFVSPEIFKVSSGYIDTDAGLASHLGTLQELF